jgi:hypothetical protein
MFSGLLMYGSGSWGGAGVAYNLGFASHIAVELPPE